MSRIRKMQHIKQFFLASTITLLFQLYTSAQAPLQFNYQAVARDSRGIPLATRDMRIRFTILNESVNGRVEYMEIRKIQTNLFGMFSVSIGSTGATFSTGTLTDVNWESGKKFLRAEIDPNGNNQYVDLGATQLVSVPYAFFAIKTLDPTGGSVFSGASGNGLSITDSTVMFGNEEGKNSARLTNNRFIPLDNHSLSFTDGAGRVSISKSLLDFQLDSVNLGEEAAYNAGIFLKVNPVYPRPDALPFFFSRNATPQNDGNTSPNEVVMWGHNLSSGGGSFIPGLPAIGYSIESNYKPTPDDRFVESHEYYVTPQGKQIRLKSYTINTKTNYVDFYHSTDNFYIKNPRTSQDYFYITNAENNSTQVLQMGNLKLHTDNVLNQFQFTASQANSQLYFNSPNWEFIFMPGLTFRTADNILEMNSNLLPLYDSKKIIGSPTNRMLGVYSKEYYGNQLMIKQDWQVNETITATSAIDIESINGFNQFRLRKTYTPSSSTDANGNTGDISWDQNYIYIKTAAGWKRTKLENF